MISIDMKDQLMEALEMFGEKVDDTVSTPVDKKLFTTYDDSEQLSDEKSEVFHSVQRSYYLS